MKISLGKQPYIKKTWKSEELSWEKFIQKCYQTIRTAETVQENSKPP